MIELKEKLNGLRNILSEMSRVIVAYSGGVDSTFLLKVAKEMLKDKPIAATATSEIHSSREIEEAKKNAKMLGVKHIMVSTNELDDPNFTANTSERCYFCKRELFSKLFELAKQYGSDYVIDGSNYDDLSVSRPGMRAASELGVKSPLKDAKLTKGEVRDLSKKMNLPTWDKPSSPCLATRFPYGGEITKEKLLKVEWAEEFLAKFGIRQLRVRDHGDIARLEVPKEDIHIFLNKDISEEITNSFKTLGYTYVCLDLQGYRMGSMDRILKRES